MRISIVTVCYNSAATVRDTLRSVASQSHPNIEHIVVDGASKDQTLALIRHHGQHVAKVVSEPDRGIYDAMNKGLALATGDFVGFLNADDIFAHEDAVAHIARAASDHGAVDAVFADLIYVDQRDTDRVIRSWRSGPFAPSRLRHGWMPPHPTLYVRAGLLKEVGMFDTSFRIAADYDFILRCLSRPGARTVYVPEVLVRMRIGGASNRSLKALLRKSREDLRALKKNQVGGWFTLLCKNVRKLPQFVQTI